VPFKPSRDKPVYCSNCFKRDAAPGSDDRGRDRRDDRGRPEMHKATCADCGMRCEVPFRPSRDKPVYCSSCFDKSGGSKKGDSFGKGASFGKTSFFNKSDSFSSAKPAQSDKKHEDMNAKLDKIIYLLQSMVPAKVVEKKVEKVAAKKVEAKKPAAKKATVKKVAVKKVAVKKPAAKKPAAKKAATKKKAK